MQKKMILSDVKAVFYKVVCANEEIEEKRYIDYHLAKQIADEQNGRVVKVTKRIVETMEFDTAI